MPGFGKRQRTSLKRLSRFRGARGAHYRVRNSTRYVRPPSSILGSIGASSMMRTGPGNNVNIRSLNPKFTHGGERCYVKLRYCQQLSTQLVLGSKGLNWRANGVYDPDAAVGGHQPLGYDQFSAMYKNVCVISSFAKVTAKAAGTQTYTHALTLRNDAPSTGLTNTTLERPHTSWGGFTGASQGMSSLPGVGFSVRRDLLQPPMEPDVSSAIDASPVRQQYFHWAINDDAAATGNTVHLTVNVLYTVVFFDRADYVGS